MKPTVIFLWALFALQLLSTAFSDVGVAFNPPQKVKFTMELPQSKMAPSQLGAAVGGTRPEDRIQNYYNSNMNQTVKRPPPPKFSFPPVMAPIPANRKEEAAELRHVVQSSPALERIQNLYKLNVKNRLPGEVLREQQKNARMFPRGKALISSVTEGKLGVRMPLMDKMKQRKEERKIAVVAARVALDELRKEQHEQQHHHHHKDHLHHPSGGIRLAKVGKAILAKAKKANKAQKGFMAIVMHQIVRAPAELMKRNPKGAPILEVKDVHNLLWNAVSLAREKLASEKTKTPACLLEFLGRMVGGAFSPFVDSKNQQFIGAFLHQIRHYELAFLSLGYVDFWRKRLGEKGLEEMEKKVKPVFINHEL